MIEQPAKVSALKKVGGSVAGVGPLSFGADLISNVAAGDNLGTAAVKATATGILGAAAPTLFMTAMAAPAARDLGLWAFNFQREKQTYWNKQFTYNNIIGGNYVDTQRAQTMRQAAIQSIQGSKLNARSALGSEARILNPYNTRKY